MKELKKAVNRLAYEEHMRANEHNNPVFASDHEAYAVILEEVSEALDEAQDVAKELTGSFWGLVRGDADFDDKEESLSKIRVSALLCACEMIQVVAMCDKAVGSIYQRSKPKAVTDLRDRFEEVLEVFD